MVESKRTSDVSEISKRVEAILIDALGVDESEITSESKLVGDFGSSWIDFLDIQFRLEKEFGIKIPNYELFPGLERGSSMYDPPELEVFTVDHIVCYIKKRLE